MSRDESMYDYLKSPEDCVFNPYAEKHDEIIYIPTVCDKSIDRAYPLYDAIDGKICMYCKSMPHNLTENKRLGKESEEYAVKKAETRCSTQFPEESPTEHIRPLQRSELVVENGAVIGAMVWGKWYVSEDYREFVDDAITYERLIFLPVSGDAQHTHYEFARTFSDVYNAVNEYTKHVFMQMVKK